jgi:NADH:ubiquinone oxidoreductase subunit E
MKKITIEICIGTNCYVMGGVDLLELEDKLAPDIAQLVEIKGTPCIDTCFQQSSQKPPFVRINGKVMAEATISKVKNAINLMLKGEE